MKTIGIAVLIVFFGMAVVLPWGIYTFALGNINGRPVPPERAILSEAESDKLWAEVREVGPIRVDKLHPYRYVSFLIGMEDEEHISGESLAWFVARDYNDGNLKSRKMLFWQLSVAALTIWRTRNWTAEQLLTKAKEIMEKKKAASNFTLNRTRTAGAALAEYPPL